MMINARARSICALLVVLGCSRDPGVGGEWKGEFVNGNESATVLLTLYENPDGSVSGSGRWIFSHANLEKQPEIALEVVGRVGKPVVALVITSGPPKSCQVCLRFQGVLEGNTMKGRYSHLRAIPPAATTEILFRRS